MPFYSGFGGRVLVGGIDGGSYALPAGRWLVEDSIELIDITTNFDSPNNYLRSEQGVKRWLDGYRTIDATFDCFHDSDLDQVNWDQNVTKVSLIPGRLIYLLLFIEAGNEFSAFHLRNFMIENVVTEVGVRDIVKYTVKGKQSGNSKLTSLGNFPGQGAHIQRPFQF